MQPAALPDPTLAQLANWTGFLVFQVYFSKWWLTMFNYGPIEWLWRSATFFRFYPFRRK
jgi:uncharacterized membrane protein YeiB